MILSFIIIILLSLGYVVLNTPLASWDARAFWVLTAKYYYYEGKFEYPDYCVYHPAPHYPKLISILMAWSCRLFGGFSDRAVKLVNYLFFCGLIFYVYIEAGWFPALLLLTFPGYYTSVTGSVNCSGADIPMGTLYTVAVVSMLHGQHLLACLFFALCLLCKQEGIPLTIIALITAVVLRLPWWWYTLPFLVLLVPGIKNVPQKNWTKERFLSIPRHIKKIPLILTYMHKHFVCDFKYYGLFAYIVLLKSRFSAYTVIPLVYYLCVLIPIYMALDTPYDFEIEFKDTSQPRLLFHVLPLLVIGIGGLI